VRSLASGIHDRSLTLAQGHRVVGDGVHQEVVIYSARVNDIYF
jgi:hypothetical protein